uniref:Uncharacterized protein n=1 Tax=Cacopsylla melanoneura TaxID=428564 RepID=A0A8D8ZCS0_9HEMI
MNVAKKNHNFLAIPNMIVNFITCFHLQSMDVIMFIVMVLGRHTSTNLVEIPTLCLLVDPLNRVRTNMFLHQNYLILEAVGVNVCLVLVILNLILTINILDLLGDFLLLVSPVALT